MAIDLVVLRGAADVVVRAAVPGIAPQGPSSDTVSPGFAGFVAVFAIAVATVGLVFSMVRHLRRVRYSTPPDVLPHVQARQAREAREAREGESHDGNPANGRPA